MEKFAFRMMERLKRLYVVVSQMEKAEGNISQMDIDLFREELRGMYAESLLFNQPESLPWESESLEEAPAVAPVLPFVEEHEEQPVEEEPVAETEEPVEEGPLAVEMPEAEPIQEEMPVHEPEAETMVEPAEEPVVEAVAEVAVATSAALHVAETLANRDTLEFAPEEPAAVQQTLTDIPSMEELEGSKNDDLFSLDQPMAPVEEEPIQPELPEPMVASEPEPVVAPQPELEVASEPEPVVAFGPEVDVVESIAPVAEPVEPEFFTPQSGQPAVEEPIVAPEPEVTVTPEPVVNDVASQAAESAPKTLWEQLQSQQAAPTLADMFQTETTPAPEPVSPWSTEPIVAAAKAQKEQEPIVDPEPTFVPEPTFAPEPTFTPEPAPKPAPTPEPIATHEPAPQQSAAPSLLDLLRQSNAPEPQVADTPHILAEAFGAASESNTESHIGRPKVADLRTVININDKFSFMSELFHNNMKAYNDFILRLNAINSRDEALAYVSEVAQQYVWDLDSLAVHTFYSILERKF